MKLLVLGPGCSRCHNLADLTHQAATELGLTFELNKITDLNQIIALGVMTTPALAVNGAVKVVGKVPTLDELKQILQEADTTLPKKE